MFRATLALGLTSFGGLVAHLGYFGFTLPSALAMFAFALLAPAMHGPALAAVLHGLKLVAVAVVAQAVWSMAQTLCPDRPRTALALVAAVLMLVAGGPGVQILALALGAAAATLARSTSRGRQRASRPRASRRWSAGEAPPFLTWCCPGG